MIMIVVEFSGDGCEELNVLILIIRRHRGLKYRGCDDAMACFRYGVGSGPVWLSGIDCTGKESSIFQCSMAHIGLPDSQCATHGYDLGLICSSEGEIVTTFYFYNVKNVLFW